MKKICGVLCAVSVLFLCASQSRADSLVVNGSFETGDFSGWTLTGNNVPYQLNNTYGVEGVDPVDLLAPVDGSYQAYFGEQVPNAITLSQSFGTVNGDQYTVSFFMAQDTAPSSEYPDAFSASFAGSTLLNLAAFGAQGYTEYSYTLDATSTSSTLSFVIGDSLGYIFLDDISVVDDTPASAATPEPSSWVLMLTGLLSVAFYFKRNELKKSLSGTPL